jgi:hypothetical protein
MHSDPRPAAEPAPALTRNALIPLSIVVCFVLVYVVRAAPFWVLPIGALVTALYLAAPWVGRRSTARLDRDLVRFLSRGEQRRLAGRYRRAIGMRLFAPPAVAAERRGLVAAESGDHRRARDAYRAAEAGYGEGEAPLSVRLGLAHACYALGDDESAVLGYRAVLRDAPGLPRVKVSLAHALARSGRDLREAERLTEELLRQAGDAPGEITLLRALVHARRGQKGPAKKLLRACEGVEGEGVEGGRARALADEVRAALA